MHPALQNEDLFIQILDHTSSRDYMAFPPVESLDQSRLETLFNVALTCRSFTEPALDELWRRIDDMSNLLRLLPAFQLFDNGTYYFDGPILDSHWDLLDKYAKRIQSVTYVNEFDIDLSVYLRLAMRGKPLLPSLCQFFTMICGPELMVMASLSLLQVYLSGSMDAHAFHPGTWAFIDTLPRVSPNLRHIYLGLPITGRSLASIFKMKNLRRLDICQSGNVADTPINSTFFAKLATLRNLSFLGLYGLIDSRTIPESQLDCVTFPELKKITFMDILPRIIPLLQTGNFPMLESLTLKLSRVQENQFLDPETEEAYWKSFFNLLKRKSGNGLKELNLDYVHVYGVIDNPIWPGPGVPASPFPDLLKLKLTKLNITYCLFDSLTNADIRMFADAWPNLEELRVASCIVGAITFEALVTAAERLPYLKKLGFSLQTVSLPDPESLPTVASHPLAYIDLFDSIITDDIQETFARSLVKLFPNLAHLKYSTNSPSSKQWDKVNAVISTLQICSRDTQN